MNILNALFSSNILANLPLHARVDLRRHEDFLLDLTRIVAVDDSLDVVGVVKLSSINHTDICVRVIGLLLPSEAHSRADIGEHAVALTLMRVAPDCVEALRVDHLSVKFGHICREAVVESLELGLVGRILWQRRYIFSTAKLSFKRLIIYSL